MDNRIIFYNRSDLKVYIKGEKLHIQSLKVEYPFSGKKHMRYFWMRVRDIYTIFLCTDTYLGTGFGISSIYDEVFGAYTENNESAPFINGGIDEFIEVIVRDFGLPYPERIRTSYDYDRYEYHFY